MTEVRKYELENCHGGEPISATDDRDIQPLVEAARNWLIEEHGTRRPSDPVDARAAAVFDALSPFDSKQNTTQGSERDEAETKAAGSSVPSDGVGAVDDGSRLQELLKWLRSKRIESERQARHAQHRQGAELHSAASLAFEAVEDHVHQLRRNKEEGQ